MSYAVPRALIAKAAFISLMFALITPGSASSITDYPEPLPFDGLYVGLHYGWADYDVTLTTPTPPAGKANCETALVGGQLGYNRQSGRFVIGVEGDATHAHHDCSAFATELLAGGILADPLRFHRNLDSELKYLLSLRARAGLAFDNLLAYGTLGWGYAKQGYSLRTTFNNIVTNFATGSVGTSGLVYGGGFEYLSQGVMYRAEYLHYDVGSNVNVGTTSITFDDIDVVRFGISVQLHD